jgi:hypothetical protein
MMSLFVNMVNSRMLSCISGTRLGKLYLFQISYFVGTDLCLYLNSVN